MKEFYQTKVLVRYQGKYLLLKTLRDVHDDHIGGWEVPGGKIDKTENPKKAALREVKEETDLNCNIIAELKFLELEKNEIKTKTHVYLAEVDTNKVNLSEEHSDYKWVTYEEIDKLKNVLYRELFKQYILDANKIK